MKSKFFAAAAWRGLTVAVLMLTLGAAQASTHPPVRTILSGGLGTLWALLFGSL